MSRPQSTLEYLKDLPLVQALWYFIENVDPNHTDRSAMFFMLRARYRNEVQK